MIQNKENKSKVQFCEFNYFRVITPLLRAQRPAVSLRESVLA